MLVVEGLGEVRFKLEPVQARGQNGGLFCRQIGVVWVGHEGLGSRAWGLREWWIASAYGLRGMRSGLIVVGWRGRPIGLRYKRSRGVTTEAFEAGVVWQSQGEDWARGRLRGREILKCGRSAEARLRVEKGSARRPAGLD